MKNEFLFSTFQKIVLIICILLMLFFEFIDLTHLGYIKDINMIKNTIIRLSAGVLLMLLLIGFGRRALLAPNKNKHALILMIPAFLIAINNFPIIATFDGRAYLTEPIYRVVLFFIECLSVGFFEELLFRGIILVLLIEYLGQKKGGIFISVLISSLIFGLLHLANLFDGASFGNTMLQVGYSFLMGMLWAVMYLKTGHLWLVMILHATYNFFGQVMFYLGVVENRFDQITIIITVVLALFTALYAVVLLRNNKLMVHQEKGEEHEI